MAIAEVSKFTRYNTKYGSMLYHCHFSNPSRSHSVLDLTIIYRDAEKRAAAQAKAQKNKLDQESKGKESKENDKESNASKCCKKRMPV